MGKIILITGATDGIGLSAAEMMVTMDHELLIHGRNPQKVEKVINHLKNINPKASIEGFIADFSRMEDVKIMADRLMSQYEKIDVLINNAGVYVAKETTTVDGFDLRFAVNTYAPYLLTKLLRPMMDHDGRVVNLSSAAQSQVSLSALARAEKMSDDQAYAQSKLAITMWTMEMAESFMREGHGPSVVAVNPKSFLGSKMVREAYGSEGHDIRIGGDILCQAAFSDLFEGASGKYFDNDRGIFAMPHPDALNKDLRHEVVTCIEEGLTAYL